MSQSFLCPLFSRLVPSTLEPMQSHSVTGLCAMLLCDIHMLSCLGLRATWIFFPQQPIDFASVGLGVQ